MTQCEPPLIIPINELSDTLAYHLKQGARLGLLTARYLPETGEYNLITLVLFPDLHRMEVWETPIAKEKGSFPSLTQKIPQAHWYERAIYDLFGLLPEGHPRFKSLILHEAWPEGYYPLMENSTEPSAPISKSYKFLTVRGQGVYEIPVGPIHAGIIEPGHFRFSCMGEEIQNLEIRLGYQHRGVEKMLTQIPWRQARFLAEAVSSDTTAGNAMAHALAIEQILDITPPVYALWLRGLALEIERAACHIGDLGGICSDIGFAAGAAIYSRLRGAALGMAERMTGSRFLTAYIRPGGVKHGLSREMREGINQMAGKLIQDVKEVEPLLLDNSGSLERMEGRGVLRPHLAKEFGLVGPAGRASGVDYDVRVSYPVEPYLSLNITQPLDQEGDILARVQVRAQEALISLQLIREILSGLEEDTPFSVPMPDTLPPGKYGVGIVEAWRGELIHLIHTNGEGGISRYSIKDPSFNNWTGLAIAARGQLIADFPLCNKSFSLSYSGNDL